MGYVSQSRKIGGCPRNPRTNIGTCYAACQTLNDNSNDCGECCGDCYSAHFLVCQKIWFVVKRIACLYAAKTALEACSLLCCRKKS